MVVRPSYAPATEKQVGLIQARDRQDRRTKYWLQVLPIILENTLGHRLAFVNFSKRTGFIPDPSRPSPIRNFPKGHPEAGRPIIIRNKKEIDDYLQRKGRFRDSGMAGFTKGLVTLFYVATNTGKDNRFILFDFDIEDLPETSVRPDVINVARELERREYVVLPVFTGSSWHVWAKRPDDKPIGDYGGIGPPAEGVVKEIVDICKKYHIPLRGAAAHVKGHFTVDYAVNRANSPVRFPLSLHHKTGLVALPLEIDEIKGLKPEEDAHPEVVLANLSKYEARIRAFFTFNKYSPDSDVKEAPEEFEEMARLLYKPPYPPQLIKGPWDGTWEDISPGDVIAFRTIHYTGAGRQEETRFTYDIVFARGPLKARDGPWGDENTIFISGIGNLRNIYPHKDPVDSVREFVEDCGRGGFTYTALEKEQTSLGGPERSYRKYGDIGHGFYEDFKVIARNVILPRKVRMEFVRPSGEYASPTVPPDDRIEDTLEPKKEQKDAPGRFEDMAETLYGGSGPCPFRPGDLVVADGRRYGVVLFTGGVKIKGRPVGGENCVWAVWCDTAVDAVNEYNKLGEKRWVSFHQLDEAALWSFIDDNGIWFNYCDSTYSYPTYSYPQGMESPGVFEEMARAIYGPAPQKFILVVLRLDGLLRFWDVDEKKDMQGVWGRGPGALAVRKDGYLAVSETSESILHVLKIWFEPGIRTKLVDARSNFNQNTSGGSKHVVWLPDGSLLTMSTHGELVHHTDIGGENRVSLRVFQLPENGQCGHSLAVSPDGKVVAIGQSKFDKHFISLYDRETWAEKGSIGTADRDPLDLSWSPDGKYLAAMVWDTLRVYDSSGQLMDSKKLKRLGDAIAWNPDGTMIASGGHDGMVSVFRFDADTLTLMAEMRATTDIVFDVGWSPDGSKLAAVTRDRHIWVWNGKDFSEIMHVVEPPAKGRGNYPSLLALGWIPVTSVFRATGKSEDMVDVKSSPPVRSRAQWRFLARRRPDILKRWLREHPVKYENLPERLEAPLLPPCSHEPVMAEGPEHAEIMIIGESPGREEVKQGRPFVGPAGKFLDHLLEIAGLERKELYITNVSKCMTQPMTPKAVSDWKPFLMDEIERVEPRIIITLGRWATNVFRAGGITQLHGQPFKWKDIEVWPMYHPAFVLHTRRFGHEAFEKNRKTMEDDFRKLGQYYKHFK